MTMPCFGMATVVSARSPACMRCDASFGCVSKAEANANKLPEGSARLVRQHVALVREALRKHAAQFTTDSPSPPVKASTRGILRIELSKNDKDFLATLPARIAGPTKTLMERGWFAFARHELRAGRNPVERPGWKRLLCDCALRSVDRQLFELRLQSELGLTAGSARTQSSTGLAIFRAGRLLTMSDHPLMVSSD